MTVQILSADERERGAYAIKLMTVADVAEMLGKTEASIRWMIHTGAGPKSALLANRRMFRESDVLAWINAAFEEAV